MFENATSFAVLPASDLARARAFWHDACGLDPVDEEPQAGVLSYEVGGSKVLVYETQFAGTAQNTAFGIDTDDLDRDMAALRSAGVEFNDYELPGVSTVDGVVEMEGMRTAWFNDSEGNIIALSQS